MEIRNGSKIKINLGVNFSDNFFGIERSLWRLFLTPFVLLVVFIVSLKIIILPKVSETLNIYSQIKDQDTKLNTIRQKTGYLLSVDKNELNKNADALNSALLKEKNSYILVSIIRRIAERYGYEISNFSVSLGQIKGDDKSLKQKTDVISKVPVSLILTGPKGKYLELISGLETSLPILSIDKFNLSASGDLANIDFTISAYYIQENKNEAITNFSLSDLTLSKQESDLLSNIGNFQKTVGLEIQGIGGQREFVRFTRQDPFSF